MLSEVFPRAHARFASLRLLGPHLNEFIVWLRAQGYSGLPIRLRISATPGLEARLRRRRVRSLGSLTVAQLLELAPRDSQDDMYRAAVVRSLARYLEAKGVLARPALTPRARLVIAYQAHLAQVRGLSASTIAHHGATAAEWLGVVGFDGDRRALRRAGVRHIETFTRAASARVSRASLQHVVAQLRSFLRFLASRGDIEQGLDACVDTPRLYRGERLPRSLPWDTVQAFLAAIDRATPMGRRDYAMFLLVTTYGLRTSEVAALRLEYIEWRAERLRVPRPKIKTPIVLPLTREVGAAVLDYLRHARPDLPCREVFLRVRAPAGRLAPTAVTEAFQTWSRRCPIAIPHQGPHCLRHSLAIHLLRQGTALKAIGDLLGHRGAESTCVYLRLHADDLRDAALDLPKGGPT